MIVGFTGSSRGIPRAQDEALGEVLAGINGKVGIKQGHHGDCVGADAAFDAWCRRLDIETHAHPGTDRSGRSPFRAFCNSTEIHHPHPYIKRNHTIVNVADLLVACPEGPERSYPRSGTWATVRYARFHETPRLIIWPDGRIEREGGST